MSDKERFDRILALEQELYQIKMRVLDQQRNDSVHPMEEGELEKFQARRAEVERQLAELGA